MSGMTLTIVPATPERWEDLVGLFGERGDPARCWCMFFRRWNDGLRDPAANREALREIVAAGREPGLLAYNQAGEAVGWVSVAPREEFLARLERSRRYRPVPGEGIWSVLCFVVKVGHRRQGIASALLDAAVQFAREHGAAAVDGHPVDTAGARTSGAAIYTGVSSMFESAGFTLLDRRGTHPVYRLTFGG
jgi:ribosomal protein S18 acetylase RimI-like enzyme